MAKGKITHIGLTISDEQTMTEFADRVVKFNLRHGGEDVKLTSMWTERVVPHCPEPHYDILMEYTSAEVADKFWNA